MAAIEMLRLGVEAYVRDMDESEYAAFVARVRPPKSPTKRNPKRRNAAGEVTRGC